MKGIKKRFPGVQALDDVSFELQRGEVHALVGENGAGKSTLMKVLMGIYKADEGEIFYKGKPWTADSPRHAQDMGVSIIHQELNLLPDLSVADNIYVTREPRRWKNTVIDDRKMHKLARQRLNELGLSIDSRAMVSSLSVAEKQMVEIAKALIVESDILVLDEPTSSLTDSEVERLFGIIRTLRDRGTGIIYISHRLEEFERIVDRVTVLRDGRFVGTKNWSETSLDEVICMMVGRALTEKFPVRDVEIGEVFFRAEHIKRGKAVRDVSLMLRRGEVLGLAGLMGAGRTELARTIFGAAPAESGKFTLEGKEVSIRTTVDAIRHGIAYLSEDRKFDGLFLDLEVSKNIVMANLSHYARMGVVDDRKCQKDIDARIRELRIKTPSSEQIAGNLSGGNQQKVLISRWLCKKSRIMIFDEPTRGIDVGAKFEVYSLINKLAAEGIGIIMISSEMPEVLGMSDRIVVMHDGRVAGELSREEATQEKIMVLASYTQREGECACCRNT
ncbi:MAG: sugar ABC transporter ATP-binding protein [Clostridiales bacterium]|nr:sugar ABC transporter ATP-binding protein [Clostridiales bacterium]